MKDVATIPDLVTIAGVLLLGWGLYLVHPAACAIFAGLYLTASGVHLARRADRATADAAARQQAETRREVGG